MVTQPKLFALNAVMLISLLLQLVMGIALFLINSGLATGPLITLMNLHTINGLIFVALVVAHIYMNMGWIRLQLLGPKARSKPVAAQPKQKAEK